MPESDAYAQAVKADESEAFTLNHALPSDTEQGQVYGQDECAT